MKPAYRIPTMDEIRAIPHNGVNVASLFCGAGGSSTGYRMAGCRVLAAVEFVPAAQESYAANKAEYTTLLRRDVRDLTAAELLKACGLEAGELDILDGSPPCEPFSTAGRRDATWGHEREYSGQRQRTDDLFFEYARLVEGVRPRAFVAENVTGLVRGRAKGYFKRIMVALRATGYVVQARVLDASWLGVPQSRQRVIIIGVRDDLGREPRFPAPLPYQYTVRDAIGDLLDGGRARMGSFSRKHNPPDITDGPAPTVVAGDSTYWHVDEPSAGVMVQPERPGFHKGRRIDLDRNPAPTLAVGGFGGLGGERGYHVEFDQQVVGNERFEPVFGPLDRPHTTVMAGGARTSGELRSSATGRRRQFTIGELKRICGFPDDYVLTGSFSQQWERLGDCVPPPMAYAWARVLTEGPLA